MLKQILNWLLGKPSLSMTRPPTKEDILLILKQLRFPHGHLALSSLLYLSKVERSRISEIAAWLDEHRGTTDRLIKEIAENRLDKVEKFKASIQTIRPDVVWPDQES